jgi:hypothetical protein
LMAGSLLLYLAPRFVGRVTAPAEVYHNWYALILALLPGAVAMAWLVFRGASLRWLVVVVASTATIVLHLTAKPVVFGFLVVFLTVIGVGLATRRATVVARAGASLIIVPILIAVGLSVAPATVQSELTRTVALRFLKQADVRDLEDLRLALDLVTAGQGTGDVTEGRFDIWRTYLSESRRGLGLAPNGFGHALPMRHQGLSAPGFPPHNIVAYYAYHGGLLAAFFLLALTGWFAVKGVRVLSRDRPTRFMEIQDHVLIGGFAFVMSVIGISLLTTTAHANDLRLGWVFWLIVVILVGRFRVVGPEPTAPVS